MAYIPAVTDAQMRATPLPVSGTVTVGNATLAVTQSGTWTVAGSGNFAITAASLPLPAGSATETTLAALNTKIGAAGQALMAASTPVVIASNQSAIPTNATLQAGAAAIGTVGVTSLPALVAGTANIGDVDVLTLPALVAGTAVIGALVANQSVNNVQLGGVAVAVGSGVTGTGVQRVVLATDVALPAGTNTLGTIMGPTLTKGTQGTVGHSTQDLKDAGRVIFSAATVIGGVTAVTAEALLSMVATRDGVAAAAATTFAVTANKRLRIQIVIGGMNGTGAAVGSTRIVLRMSPSGAVTATSPILAIITLNGPAAVALTGDHQEIILPDGLEFSGAHQFGLSHVSAAITGTIRVSIIGYEY